MGRRCEQVVCGGIGKRVRRFAARAARRLVSLSACLLAARPVAPTPLVGEASSGDAFKLSLPLCVEFLVRAMAGFGDAPLAFVSAVDLPAILMGVFRILNVAVIVLSAAATVFTACVTWVTKRKCGSPNGCDVVDDRSVVRIAGAMPLRDAFWFAVRVALAVSPIPFAPDVV